MSNEQRCGGTGMVAYWDGSAYAGEFCRGCIDCDPHDEHCESELTSHGYTPCRCAERLGVDGGCDKSSEAGQPGETENSTSEKSVAVIEGHPPAQRDAS